MKNKIFPHTFWRPFLDCMPQLFYKPKYVWFPIHLKGPMIPDPSGQLAELIVYITSTRVDLYSHQILLHEPRIFYPSGHWPETVTNAHVSTHFRQSLGASVISTHIRTEGLYVKTTLIYQLKRMCVPDCAYTENMFINSIHINLFDISLTQNILYQIKRDVVIWKRLGCPPA